jgi:hypothetical protein
MQILAGALGGLGQIWHIDPIFGSGDGTKAAQQDFSSNDGSRHSGS